MDEAFVKLTKFKPKTMVGNGPFKLDSMNTQQAKLVKSDSYVDAEQDQDSAGRLRERPAERRPVRVPDLAEARLLQRLPARADRDEAEPHGYHAALPPSFEFAMYFNTAKYPLSITEVRQALAYAIAQGDDGRGVRHHQRRRRAKIIRTGWARGWSSTG